MVDKPGNSGQIVDISKILATSIVDKLWTNYIFWWIKCGQMRSFIFTCVDKSTIS